MVWILRIADLPCLGVLDARDEKLEVLLHVDGGHCVGFSCGSSVDRDFVERSESSGLEGEETQMGVYARSSTRM